MIQSQFSTQMSNVRRVLWTARLGHGDRPPDHQGFAEIGVEDLEKLADAGKLIDIEARSWSESGQWKELNSQSMMRRPYH